MGEGFELVGRPVTESGVFAAGIVVAFNELEDLNTSVVGVLEAAALKHFELEGADERFGPGVVIGIGARRHALAQAGLRESTAEEGAAVLTAAIAVEDGSAGR